MATTPPPRTPGLRGTRDKYISLLLSDTSAPPPAAATPATGAWTPGTHLQYPHAGTTTRQAPFPPTPAWGSPITPHQFAASTGATTAHATSVANPTEPDFRVAELAAGLVAAGDNQSRQASTIRRLADQLQRSNEHARKLEDSNRRLSSARRRSAGDAEEPVLRQSRSSQRRARSSTRSDAHVYAHDRRRTELSDDEDHDIRPNSREKAHSRSPSPSPPPPPPQSRLSTHTHRRSRGSTSRSSRARAQSPHQPNRDRSPSLSTRQVPNRSVRPSEHRTTRHIHFSPLHSADPARASTQSANTQIPPVVQPLQEQPRVHHAQPPLSGTSDLQEEVIALRQERASWIAERRKSDAESQALSNMLADIKRNTQRLLSERTDHLAVIARLQEDIARRQEATTGQGIETSSRRLSPRALSSPAGSIHGSPQLRSQPPPSPQRVHEGDPGETQPTSQSLTASIHGEEPLTNVHTELQEELRLALEENARLVERSQALEMECRAMNEHINAEKLASIREPTANELVRLVEEVDILEGVSDAIHFGTQRDSSTTQEISLTHPSGLPVPRETTMEPVNPATAERIEGSSSSSPANPTLKETVQRISDIRASLSVKYGRWIDALNHTNTTGAANETLTSTTSSAPISGSGDVTTGSIDIHQLIEQA